MRFGGKKVISQSSLGAISTCFLVVMCSFKAISMRTITILFVLMMASVVQAQVLAVRAVEKKCDQSSCRQFINIGSCTYIGNTGNNSIYITAAHVVENTEKVEVGYGGKWWGAVVSHSEKSGNIDYAIIETRKIPATRCYSLAESFPEQGTNATAYGYSKGIYNLRSLRSKIRIRNNLKGIFETVDHGDSGGPIIANGKVVGVISATMTDDGMTVCTPSDLIRTEVKRRYRVFPCCNCGPSKAVTVSPIQPVPDPIGYDNSKELATLKSEVTKLRQQIAKLSATKIPVWLIGADGKPVATQEYPLGSPIKLKFKAITNNGK